VYPKGGPNMIPEVVSQPEISYTVEPMPVIEPPYEPVTPERVAEPAEEPAPKFAEPLPAELPRTATPLPLMAIGGLTSLLAGLGLGLLRRRSG
jgi:LPXTG-motif cell wall-anchored protein